MLGTTHARMLDGALDEIGRLGREHDNALEAVSAFIRRHPEFEDDHNLTVARLALL